jgi:predicted ATPase
VENRTVQLFAVVRRPGSGGEFPFSVPAIATLERLELSTPVTLFVGENGTGKSTLIEALAIAAKLPAVGAAGPAADPTLAAQRRLADHLRLSWAHRDHRGFFLRAEDFFGFQKRIARERSEHEREMRRSDEELAGASAHARTLARLPHATS